MIVTDKEASASHNVREITSSNEDNLKEPNCSHFAVEMTHASIVLNSSSEPCADNRKDAALEASKLQRTITPNKRNSANKKSDYAEASLQETLRTYLKVIFVNFAWKTRFYVTKFDFVITVLML